MIRSRRDIAADLAITRAASLGTATTVPTTWTVLRTASFSQLALISTPSTLRLAPNSQRVAFEIFGSRRRRRREGDARPRRVHKADRQQPAGRLPQPAGAPGKPLERGRLDRSAVPCVPVWKLTSSVDFTSDYLTGGRSKYYKGKIDRDRGDGTYDIASLTRVTN